MLDLRLSVINDVSAAFWYIHLADLPLDQYLKEINEMPCNLKELQSSVQASGVYCLCQCSCGDRSCKSLWVEVGIKGNTISWGRAFKNDAFGQQGDCVGIVDWSFNTDEFMNTIKVALSVDSVAAPIIEKS